MSTLPAEPAQATLSLAQQRNALWADARQRVYALLVGARVPGLREQLAHADVDDWDGLWTGELDDIERAAAPVLVTLKRESAFTDWLLGAAALSFEGWGALALGKLPFLAMRSHGRALCRAQLPNGQAIRIDWMDPEVMEALLPVAGADMLQRVYAGLDELLTLRPDRWTRWSVEGARLHRTTTGVRGP
ncbi:MAG: DUF4123 domain-containing protein [Pseudomonadota bacterium]|nr:DUF4123 domain-containing protein [Pseudomonadota bacterium]MDQ2764419.1 DUF4123 domain-containing protein [Pseudomonadota bacterium]